MRNESYIAGLVGHVSQDQNPHHSIQQSSVAASDKAVVTPQRKRFGRDVHTGTHKVVNVEQENDRLVHLTDRFIRLKAILGRNPEFVELYDAGFVLEEIDLLELLLSTNNTWLDDVRTRPTLESELEIEIEDVKLVVVQ